MKQLICAIGIILIAITQTSACSADNATSLSAAAIGARDNIINYFGTPDGMRFRNVKAVNVSTGGDPVYLICGEVSILKNKVWSKYTRFISSQFTSSANTMVDQASNETKFDEWWNERCRNKNSIAIHNLWNGK